jgi:hypothetical protein
VPMCLHISMHTPISAVDCIAQPLRQLGGIPPDAATIVASGPAFVYDLLVNVDDNSTRHSPGPRSGAAMTALSPSSDEMILFGGVVLNRTGTPACLLPTCCLYAQALGFARTASMQQISSIQQCLASAALY